MKKIAVFLVFLLPQVYPVIAAAQNLSLGAGYPYLSIKYDLPVLAVEGRVVTGSGVQAYAGRGYWNFYQADKLKGFAGLEGGYVKFNTLNIKGTGSDL